MGSRVGNGVVVVTAVMEERASYWVARRQRRLVWMMDLCCIGCVAASLLVLMLSGEFPLALLWTNVAALILSIFFGRTDFVTRHRRWFNVLLVSSLVSLGVLIGPLPLRLSRGCSRAPQGSWTPLGPLKLPWCPSCWTHGPMLS